MLLMEISASVSEKVALASSESEATNLSKVEIPVNDAIVGVASELVSYPHDWHQLSIGCLETFGGQLYRKAIPCSKMKFAKVSIWYVGWSGFV